MTGGAATLTVTGAPASGARCAIDLPGRRPLSLEGSRQLGAALAECEASGLSSLDLRCRDCRNYGSEGSLVL